MKANTAAPKQQGYTPVQLTEVLAEHLFELFGQPSKELDDEDPVGTWQEEDTDRDYWRAQATYLVNRMESAGTLLTVKQPQELIGRLNIIMMVPARLAYALVPMHVPPPDKPAAKA